MSNQNKNNNLNYLIDTTFSNVNRLFILSFENEDDRTSYYKYYLPSVEIKDYNVLIDGNAFFELPIKNIEETYEKIIQITDHSGYYTRGNLLDYEYFKEHYKLIAIDLSKQIEPRFNGVYSKNNLPKTIKKGAYVINLDEYENTGTHWVSLFVKSKYTTELSSSERTVYFDSFGVEHIPREINKFICLKN